MTERLSQGTIIVITDSKDMILSRLRELLMNREAWRATLHEVTKSWTWPNDWTELRTNINVKVPYAVIALLNIQGYNWLTNSRILTIKDCLEKIHDSNSRLCEHWTPPAFYLWKREPLVITVRRSLVRFTPEGQTRWTLPSRTHNWNCSLSEIVSSKTAAQSSLCRNNWWDSEGWGLATRVVSTTGWALGTRPGAKVDRRETSQCLYWFKLCLCLCYFTCAWNNL